MLQTVLDLTNTSFVVVEAVPGAGKTHLLCHLSDRTPSLILAYNTQLANDIGQHLSRDSMCLTFHGLCGRCIDVARDDYQLQCIVAEAEQGKRAIGNVPNVSQVLIDEAQDVRGVYVRLLRVLGLLRDDVRILCCGDRNQLVYDFDDDFPASLDVLCTPQTSVVPGRWMRVLANESRRLTGPMCTMVNEMFGTSIQSDREGPPVEIRCPRSSFQLSEAISDLLDTSFLLLVDRRRNNRPLREFLNTLSRRSITMHVHGVDAQEATDEQVRCATFWSAKGLQHDTVVVLLPGMAPRNPTYVALTRSCRRLVVVLDPKDPNAALCATVVANPSAFVVHGNVAQRVVSAGSQVDPVASFGKRPRWKGGLTCLDNTAPQTSVVYECCSMVVMNDPTFPSGGDEDSGGNMSIVVGMAATWAELCSTGRVRIVEGMLQPCRMDRDARDSAIASGFVGRVVGRYQTDAMILSPDLLRIATTAYRRLESQHDDLSGTTWGDLFDLSCAILSWDNLEHVMRQSRFPVDRARVQDAIEWVRSTIPHRAQFDTICLSTDRRYHARVHAMCPLRTYHITWNSTSSDVGLAAVRALLHPSSTCWILSMDRKLVTMVRVLDMDRVWSSLEQSDD